MRLGTCIREVLIGGLLFLAIVGTSWAQAPQSEFEQPPVFAPQQVLPAELVSGQDFRVYGDVLTEGFLYTFNLWTSFASYQPASLAILEQRIRETYAIAALEKLQQDPQFVEGLSGYVGDTASGISSTLQDPVGTIQRIPMGLEKFFGRVQDSANYQGGSRTEGNTSMLYGKQKRQLAAQLGVDPYSDNPVLQNLLNEVAGHRAFGQLTAKIGTFLIPGGVGVGFTAVNVNSTIQSLQKEIVEKSPAELQQINRGVLTAMNVPAGDINRFLTHPAYSPADQTVITRSLEQLSAVKNIQQYLATCLDVPSSAAGGFQVQAVIMVAAYHARVRPLTELQIIGQEPIFTNADNVLLAFKPIDCLYWALRVQEAVDRVAPSGSGRQCEIWISGRATRRAAEELGKRSVKVVQEACTPLQLKITTNR